MTVTTASHTCNGIAPTPATSCLGCLQEVAASLYTALRAFTDGSETAETAAVLNRAEAFIPEDLR